MELRKCNTINKIKYRSTVSLFSTLREKTKSNLHGWKQLQWWFKPNKEYKDLQKAFSSEINFYLYIIWMLIWWIPGKWIQIEGNFVTFYEMFWLLRCTLWKTSLCAWRWITMIYVIESNAVVQWHFWRTSDEYKAYKSTQANTAVSLNDDVISAD